MRRARISVYDIVLIGVMVAALESVKLVLSFLPNVELVTLLIILFTLAFGKKTYYAVVSFVVLEGLLYGFGIWWVMYIYTWPLLVCFTRILRRQKDGMTFALLSGAFDPVSVFEWGPYGICLVGGWDPV